MGDHEHLEQTRDERDAILRGLSERAALAREFRSCFAILALRVRIIVREKHSRKLLG